MRKITTAITAILLAAMMTAGISAYDAETAEKQADALNEMGLFKGTDNGYDLENVPTRAQSSVMLVRFLGKEEEAMGLEYTAPFNDVADWAKPYIQYLWQNGLANGYGDGRYGADDPCTAQMYATIVLRVLGYSDKDAKDFTYDKAIEFATGKGLDCPAEGFLRGDMVGMTYDALSIGTADGKYEMLADRLAEDGTITDEQAEGIISGLRIVREDNKYGFVLYYYGSDDTLVREERYHPDGIIANFTVYYPSGTRKLEKVFWQDGITPHDIIGYDEEGRMNLYQAYGETGVMWHWQINEYDGNVETVTMFYNDGSVKQVSVSEEIGERTYKVHVTGYNEDGSIRSQSANICTDNENGLPIKLIYLDDNEEPRDYQIIGYDEYGNQCSRDNYDMDDNFLGGWKDFYIDKTHVGRTEWYTGGIRCLYRYKVYEYDENGKLIGSETFDVNPVQPIE